VSGTRRKHAIAQQELATRHIVRGVCVHGASRARRAVEERVSGILGDTLARAQVADYLIEGPE
jgi:hypothetical protein